MSSQAPPPAPPKRAAPSTTGKSWAQLASGNTKAATAHATTAVAARAGAAETSPEGTNLVEEGTLTQPEEGGAAVPAAAGSTTAAPPQPLGPVPGSATSQAQLNEEMKSKMAQNRNERRQAINQAKKTAKKLAKMAAETDDGLPGVPLAQQGPYMVLAQEFADIVTTFPNSVFVHSG